MKKFLLHTCCGPCGIHIFEKLAKDFEVTAYFYNPNIHPSEEYLRRLEAARDSVAAVASGVKLVEGSYDPEKWIESCLPYKNEPEGGKRCAICFRIRMEEAARYAKENSFDVWGTTITSGRNKKAEIINAIGEELAKKYGVKFQPADWKKGGGQERSRILCKEKNIYHQKYCGCLWSIRANQN
jgi:predicted adenine nucleotide alpha hydrolase (AANH) superfamily ATPase